MVYAQDGKLKEHGIKFIFAGTQRWPDKTSYSNAISKHGSTQAFRDDKNFWKRKEAGAVIESV